ncbi:MAG: thioredoxin-dependent thiol peroxidase [Halofilum sp. (in: g-proteobacteria)]
MPEVTSGEPAPDFCLPATGGREIRLSDLRGSNVVLYFYPKDSTPGCTTEGQGFRDHAGEFAAANTIVLGVSRDSVKSHERFREKQGFHFDLISDTDEAACSAYGVIKEKSLYGKWIRGVERSTFLIDAEGVVRQVWRKVKVRGHVEEVLEAARAL